MFQNLLDCLRLEFCVSKVRNPATMIKKNDKRINIHKNKKNESIGLILVGLFKALYSSFIPQIIVSWWIFGNVESTPPTTSQDKFGARFRFFHFFWINIWISLEIVITVWLKVHFVFVLDQYKFTFSELKTFIRKINCNLWDHFWNKICFFMVHILSSSNNSI